MGHQDVTISATAGEVPAPPSAMVIFGANGDLTRRMLMPALYRLAYEGRLAAGFSVVGISRTPMADEQFREKMRASVRQFLKDSPFDEQLWEEFAKGLFYLDGDIFDAGMYERLKARLDEVERTRMTQGNVLFYLSTQPSQYGPIAKALSGSGLNAAAEAGSWRRIIVEKPFGHDLESADQLNRELQGVFTESDIYRIDHYLGKETVQNILAFRFGNGIFEPLWNRRYVDHVQITAAERIGVEGRGAYYQEAGALRDMIQNHLLQVMATIAMEPPSAYDPRAVRDERSKLLRAIRIMKPEDVAGSAVRGQYGAGMVDGEAVAGFREEPGVDAEAQTDTYAALRLEVENWRWAGVPFYIRSGKRMPKRVTDVAIQFNCAPLSMFGGGTQRWPNLLVLRIQPEEGISLRFSSKAPGQGMSLQPVNMDFNYGTSFTTRSPAAYETLLLDALQGDATLYTRQDMVEASWRVVEPVLGVWGETRQELPNYAAGTWGPAASDEMLAERGHKWRTP